MEITVSYLHKFYYSLENLVADLMIRNFDGEILNQIISLCGSFCSQKSSHLSSVDNLAFEMAENLYHYFLDQSINGMTSEEIKNIDGFWTRIEAIPIFPSFYKDLEDGIPNGKIIKIKNATAEHIMFQTFNEVYQGMALWSCQVGYDCFAYCRDNNLKITCYRDNDKAGSGLFIERELPLKSLVYFDLINDLGKYKLVGTKEKRIKFL